jgi:hypothetical protein
MKSRIVEGDGGIAGKTGKRTNWPPYFDLPDLLCFYSTKPVQALPCFNGLRTVRIALHDLAPSGASESLLFHGGDAGSIPITGRQNSPPFIPDHGPKRPRYSLDTMNDFTMSEVMKLPPAAVLGYPEVVAGKVSVRRVVRISSRIAEVLHLHKAAIQLSNLCRGANTHTRPLTEFSE